MKDIIDKISSYNIFNYLFPGIVFVILLDQVTNYDLIIENNFLGAFLYYFIGLVISRIGSIILDPIFKKIKIVKFFSYSDFLLASKNDDKVSLFSEINNTYRTLSSTFFCLLISVIYEKFVSSFFQSTGIEKYILVVGLLVLFILSYRKQTEYINDRINNQLTK
ncbi:hypothetical protein FMIA91_13850 [Fidelibacter multiformis]